MDTTSHLIGMLAHVDRVVHAKFAEQEHGKNCLYLCLTMYGAAMEYCDDPDVSSKVRIVCRGLVEELWEVQKAHRDCYGGMGWWGQHPIGQAKRMEAYKRWRIDALRYIQDGPYDR